MTWRRIWKCRPTGWWWWIPDASLDPGRRQTSDMTFNLCVSLPLTARLQDDGLSPAGELMDQEEATLSSSLFFRRWSLTDITFSFCGALRCVDSQRFVDGLNWTQKKISRLFFIRIIQTWVLTLRKVRWGLVGKLVISLYMVQTAFLLQHLETGSCWMLGGNLYHSCSCSTVIMCNTFVKWGQIKSEPAAVSTSASWKQMFWSSAWSAESLYN